MFIAIQLGFALVGFFVLLNGFLQGAWKSRIEVVLSVLLMIVVLGAFYLLGWKSAVVSIGLAFLYAQLTRPIAARAAVRLMGLDGSGGSSYPGLPPRWLHALSQRLGKAYSRDPGELVQESMRGTDDRAQAELQLVAIVRGNPAAQAWSDRPLSDNELKELYRLLVANGAGQWAVGHWVAASAIAYPHTLRWALSARDAAIPPIDIAFNLQMHFERGTPLPATANRGG